MQSLASSAHLTQLFDPTHHNVIEPSPTQPTDGPNPCPSLVYIAYAILATTILYNTFTN